MLGWLHVSLPDPKFANRAHTRAHECGRDEQTRGGGSVNIHPTPSPRDFPHLLRLGLARRGCRSRIVAESTSFPAMVNFGESGQAACTRTPLFIKNRPTYFFTNASNNVQRRRWRRRNCFAGRDRIFVTDLIRRRAARRFDAAEPQNAPGPHRRSGRAPTRRQKGRAATNVHKDQRRPSHAVIATVETRRPEDHFERADRLGWSKWREKSRSFLAGL